MRGDRAPRDSRHNKDHGNLKSSLKKGHRPKKHRVVFNESANEFFEADYIIVVRDECFSDEGETEDCSGCGGCERHREAEPGALSPPDGYKDMGGLFNSDGTLREQAWWEAGDVVLVGERSGTVFTPHHLQLLRRLQRERMLRSTLCADCDAHAALHQPLGGTLQVCQVSTQVGSHTLAYQMDEALTTYVNLEGEIFKVLWRHTIDNTRQIGLKEAIAARKLSAEAVMTAADGFGASDMEYAYEDEESDLDRELRPLARRTGKHIAAGEERPRINSSQQTTPTDDCSLEVCLEEIRNDIAPSFVSEESDTGETEGSQSQEGSPKRQKKSGILKGGRLWKSLEIDEQNDDQRSTTTTASDDEYSMMPRSVRFADRTRDPCDGETDSNHGSESIQRMADISTKEFGDTQRIESPVIMAQPTSIVKSAVNQLFNSGRPPPPAIESHLVTSESLRAWNADLRPKSEEAAVRRVAERNALRCSLLRSEARKKQQAKPQETTSLTERIRLLTCDVEEDLDDGRYSPSGASIDKTVIQDNKNDQSKSLNVNEKAFGGGGSTSSSTSTLSAQVPNPGRQQPPDLGDNHQERQKSKSEPRRQFLSTLAPLTACVSSDSQHEGFYYAAAGDRHSGSSATSVEVPEAPAPDVVAGTPGAGEGDDGLAAFARASGPRTERLRQKYGHDSQPVSSDDEHDDYGFNRRPEVRGITAKQLGASDDMIQQMQNELQPSPAPPHSCQRTNTIYSWPYCSDSRPQSRASNSSNWSKPSDYVIARPLIGGNMQPYNDLSCYMHPPPAVAAYAMHVQRHTPDYTACNALYSNVGCSDSSQEIYSSQTSSEQASPIRSGSRCRRPESPPPIRSHHRMVYLPYSAHHHHHQDYPQSQWSGNDYERVQQFYQHQQHQVTSSGASTPQPPIQAQRALYSHPLQIQTLCPVPARYRTVPAAQPGGGTQMICFSEKVAPPLYQPAPGSPARARGVPEGAPAAAVPTDSPPAPSPNPLYYAMNV